MEPLAVVRIRISDLAMEWLDAVGELVRAVEAGEPERAEECAARVREVMLTPEPADGQEGRATFGG